MINEFDPNIRITLTENANTKISSILKDKEFIRLYIQGGGCSGFQYMFDVVSDKEDDDIQIPGSRLLIDTLSYQYIENSQIDYSNDLLGSKFIVNNPQATTTCGCGQSFTI
jgi:iron-sulfur cluster insertion protein